MEEKKTARRGTLASRAAARVARVLARLATDTMARHLNRPCFIIGCGRSGTTVLTDVLSFHPSVAVYPSEANDLWHSELYPWHQSEGDVAPIWTNPREFTRNSLEGLDWSYIKAVFGSFEWLMNKEAFINKSVMLSFMIEEIAKNIPNAKFIHMVRDGRAVALSYAKKNLPKVREYASLYASAGVRDNFEALISLSFDHWLDHIEAVEEADRKYGLKDCSRLLEFSYEDFSLEPISILSRVFEYLGLDALDRDWLSARSIENRNYKVSAELSPELLQVLTDRGAATLIRRGYRLDV